jgi:hypothetical protein
MNNFGTIEIYISSPRLNRYLLTTNNNKSKALKLYQTNIRLSQSFYPLLSLLEIILRNSLNKEMANHFKSKNWIIDQIPLFFSDTSLGPKYYLKTEVNKRIAKLREEKKPITNDNIIAGLTLGFWVALFYPASFKLLKGTPLKCLSNKPTTVNGTNFKKKLERIRDFRNKIYHNEPIIFSKSQAGDPLFTTSHVNDIYLEIKQIFDYFNLDFKRWTRRLDNIPLEVKRANAVFNHYPKKIYYYHRIKVGVQHLQYKYSQS